MNLCSIGRSEAVNVFAVYERTTGRIIYKQTVASRHNRNTKGHTLADRRKERLPTNTMIRGSYRLIGSKEEIQQKKSL